MALLVCRTDMIKRIVVFYVLKSLANGCENLLVLRYAFAEPAHQHLDLAQQKPRQIHLPHERTFDISQRSLEIFER